MATSLVQIRVDKDLKEEVIDIYARFGIDLPTAIRMFFKKSVMVNGLPFELNDSKPVDSRSRWPLYEKARELAMDVAETETTLEDINKEIAAVRKSSHKDSR